MNRKNNTWSKIQIIGKTEDYRYVYKYGKNTTTDDKLLIDSGYDRSLKYKPNNLYNLAKIGPCGLYWCLQWDTLFWEPPLQNNNHLTGYILFASKFWLGEGIDTTEPIDIMEWDSIAFFSNRPRSHTA